MPSTLGIAAASAAPPASELTYEASSSCVAARAALGTPSARSAAVSAKSPREA